MSKHTSEPSQHQFIELKGRALNLTGHIFGRLTAVGPVGRNKHGQLLWLCKCSCRKETVVTLSNLRGGSTKSCGCLHIEHAANLNKIHSLSKDHIYNIWSNMKARCNNPNNSRYNCYGERNIAVYEPWIHDFIEFYKYVSKLEHAYDSGYTLDRINNLTGNYEPGNLRFVTTAEQNRNTRQNHMLTYNGETKCITDWAHTIGIAPSTLMYRVNSGWSINKALTTPLITKYKKKSR